MAEPDRPVIPDVRTLDPATVPNAVLQRLIAEVQAEGHDPQRAYDRTHHRHNRGPGGPPQPPRPPQEPPPDAQEGLS